MTAVAEKIPAFPLHQVAVITATCVGRDCSARALVYLEHCAPLGDEAERKALVAAAFAVLGFFPTPGGLWCRRCHQRSYTEAILCQSEALAATVRAATEAHASMSKIHVVDRRTSASTPGR